MFSGCTVPPHSKETQLGSSHQEGSSSAGKNTGITLVRRCTWKSIPKAISGGVDISEVPGCQLLWQMSSQWGSQKSLQGLVSHELAACLSVFNLFLSQWIMTILSKGSKPDNSEPHNCQTLLTFLLYVRQTGMTQLILEIICKALSPFNPKNMLISMFCNLGERRTSFCMGVISRKLWGFLIIFSTGFTSLSVLLLFPLLITFFIFMHGSWFYFI